MHIIYYNSQVEKKISNTHTTHTPPRTLTLILSLFYSLLPCGIRLGASIKLIKQSVL